MSYEFRVNRHGFLPGKLMVEVWRDGVFVAGIYPHEDGIRIVSKYMSEVKKDAEVADGKGGWIPAMSIKLEQKPVGHSNQQLKEPKYKEVLQFITEYIENGGVVPQTSSKDYIAEEWQPLIQLLDKLRP